MATRKKYKHLKRKAKQQLTNYTSLSSIYYTTTTVLLLYYLLPKTYFLRKTPNEIDPKLFKYFGTPSQPSTHK